MELVALRGLTTPLAAAGDRPATRFTPLELAAAEQLIHLSESSCSSGGAVLFSTPRGGGPAPAPSAASASSSSPRSVNAPLAPPAPARDFVLDAEEEDDEEDAAAEQEVGGRPRKNRRYRPIAEIYGATEPASARRRKDKAAARRRRKGGEEEVERD